MEQLKISIRNDIAKGQAIRGGSTITQQLAKNLYLSPSRDPVRKLRELIIARRMEAALSKGRIFEIYLNVIEWGDGIWGVEAAARSYFGTSASALSPDQAALLAGAIINPRIHSPAHPTARLRRRQQIILRRMGLVTPPEEAPDVPEPAPLPWISWSQLSRLQLRTFRRHLRHENPTLSHYRPSRFRPINRLKPRLRRRRLHNRGWREICSRATSNRIRFAILTARYADRYNHVPR